MARLWSLQSVGFTAKPAQQTVRSLTAAPSRAGTRTKPFSRDSFPAQLESGRAPWAGMLAGCWAGGGAGAAQGQTRTNGPTAH